MQKIRRCEKTGTNGAVPSYLREWKKLLFFYHPVRVHSAGDSPFPRPRRGEKTHLSRQLPQSKWILSRFHDFQIWELHPLHLPLYVSASPARARRTTFRSGVSSFFQSLSVFTLKNWRSPSHLIITGNYISFSTHEKCFSNHDLIFIEHPWF